MHPHPGPPWPWQEITSVRGDMKKLKPLCIAGKNYKMMWRLRKTVQLFPKTLNVKLYDPANSLSSYIPKRTESRDWAQLVHPCS